MLCDQCFVTRIPSIRCMYRYKVTRYLCHLATTVETSPTVALWALSDLMHRAIRNVLQVPTNIPRRRSSNSCFLTDKLSKCLIGLLYFCGSLSILAILSALVGRHPQARRCGVHVMMTAHLCIDGVKHRSSSNSDTSLSTLLHPSRSIQEQRQRFDACQGSADSTPPI